MLMREGSDLSVSGFDSGAKKCRNIGTPKIICVSYKVYLIN